MHNVITHAQARRVAADWHVGQYSALFMLAANGAIPDPDKLLSEIKRERSAWMAHELCYIELSALARYVEETGTRPCAVPNWPTAWDDTTPITKEMGSDRL